MARSSPLRSALALFLGAAGVRANYDDPRKGGCPAGNMAAKFPFGGCMCLPQCTGGTCPAATGATAIPTCEFSSCAPALSSAGLSSWQPDTRGGWVQNRQATTGPLWPALQERRDLPDRDELPDARRHLRVPVPDVGARAGRRLRDV